MSFVKQLFCLIFGYKFQRVEFSLGFSGNDGGNFALWLQTQSLNFWVSECLQHWGFGNSLLRKNVKAVPGG